VRGEGHGHLAVGHQRVRLVVELIVAGQRFEGLLAVMLMRFVVRGFDRIVIGKRRAVQFGIDFRSGRRRGLCRRAVRDAVHGFHRC